MSLKLLRRTSRAKPSVLPPVTCVGVWCVCEREKSIEKRKAFIYKALKIFK